MPYHVEKSVIDAADKCPRNRGCLASSNGQLCRILAWMENGASELFVQCQENAACPYQEGLNGRHACRCPVRIRIFQRYGR